MASEEAFVRVLQLEAQVKTLAGVADELVGMMAVLTGIVAKLEVEVSATGAHHPFLRQIQKDLRRLKGLVEGARLT